MMNPEAKIDPGSFRDRSGFVFFQRGQVYRHVSLCYKEDYDALMQTGAYQALLAQGLIIPHDEVDPKAMDLPEAYKVLKPERVNFISYPYEWCFGQLKDAALATLEIQRLALDHGMSLKDSSAYNIQFVSGRPVFIDTLSFERYKEGKPWVAYRQFCQHFLAPLALMSMTDVRLGKMLSIFVDGIPIALANTVLPRLTPSNWGLMLHLRIQGFAGAHMSGASVKDKPRNREFGKHSFIGLIESLQRTVDRLSWKARGEGWAGYYRDGSVAEEYFEAKKILVADFLKLSNPSSVCDFGSNTGVFARIASSRGIQTVCCDADYGCVEDIYQHMKRGRATNILPLHVDLTNPSPSIGWKNEERRSFLERGPVDLILALGLIHHLAISNNLPFASIASLFCDLCKWLAIEYVPKTDPMVQRLLLLREDVFGQYTNEQFEDDFGQYYRFERKEQIKGSRRILYLMKRREN